MGLSYLLRMLRGACSVAPDLCLCMSVSRAARGWFHVRIPEIVMDCCSLRWIGWIPYRTTYLSYNIIGIIQHHIILDITYHIYITYIIYHISYIIYHISYIYIYISHIHHLSSNLQIFKSHHPSDSNHSKAAAVSWPHWVLAQCHLLSRLSRCFRCWWRFCGDFLDFFWENGDEHNLETPDDIDVVASWKNRKRRPRTPAKKNPKTMKPLKIHTRIHMKVMATGGGIAAMVLNAWKGHLLSRRQREQLYATGSAFGEKIRHDFDDSLDVFFFCQLNCLDYDS